MGSQGGVLASVWERMSGEADEMVAEGKSEVRALWANVGGLTRSRGQEWKEGWVVWRAAVNVPKPQLSESQPAGWDWWKMVRDAEWAGETDAGVLEERKERTGREERARLGVREAEAGAAGAGGRLGHLVVYLGKREGSKTAGLVRYASVRRDAR